MVGGGKGEGVDGGQLWALDGEKSCVIQVCGVWTRGGRKREAGTQHSWDGDGRRRWRRHGNESIVVSLHGISSTEYGILALGSIASGR